MENLVELVHIIPALEERLSSEQFGQNTSHGPHIDCALSVLSISQKKLDRLTRFGIGLEGQHNFRSSVPTSGHIFCACVSGYALVPAI